MDFDEWYKCRSPAAMFTALGYRQAYTGMLFPTKSLVAPLKLSLWVQWCRLEEKRMTGRPMYSPIVPVEDTLWRALYAWVVFESDGRVPNFQQRADALRDAVGYPFEPVQLVPAWLTHSVTCLTQAVREQCSFEHLPVLADALEEAGCSNERVLKHLRKPNLHIRGCWMLDMLGGSYGL